MRNVTIFADGELDRSPCGSGTSAILAWMSASGSSMTGATSSTPASPASPSAAASRPTTLGGRDAVITSVAGTAYVTGYQTFIVDDRDPLGDGFLLR